MSPNSLPKTVTTYLPSTMGNCMAKMSPDKIVKLGVKLLTMDPLSNEETSFAPAYSAEAPRLCHLIAKGYFSLREGDDIDFKDVEIGDQNETELDQAVSEAITCASKNLPNRLKDSFTAMILDFKDVFCIRLGADTPVTFLLLKSSSRRRSVL